MLNALRRWSARGKALPAWPELVAWAQAQGWALRRTMAHDGWVMDQGRDHPAWRIEWGPAQRRFMSSHEFRIRIALARSPDVQALVLDRPLMARLDREVYQQFTDSVQTRLDDETPEEMRWLAMHSPLKTHEIGAGLRDRYGAVGDDPAWIARWLAGPLGSALTALAERSPADAVAAEPFALRLARGSIVLRQSATRPSAATLQACVRVAAAAQQGVVEALADAGADRPAPEPAID